MKQESRPLTDPPPIDNPGQEMMLRPAKLSEQAAVHELCMRAKASWGYDSEFMRACQHVLVLDAAAIEQERAIVAVVAGELAGVAQVSLGPHSAELDLLFVEPRMQGCGIGRELFRWARQRAQTLGASTLRILSDPGARGFYERQGALFEHMAPSDAVPGRELPMLSIDCVYALKV